MDENQLQLTGKQGNSYTFFPRFNLQEDKSSKGSGIYVFTNDKRKIIDIQFLSGENEIETTLRRMKDDGAIYFYFKDEINELQSDANIDDMKDGDDYRNNMV